MFPLTFDPKFALTLTCLRAMKLPHSTDALQSRLGASVRARTLVLALVFVLGMGWMPAVQAQPAVIAGIAAFEAGDYKKALDLLEGPGLAGNADAAFHMGRLREQGLGMVASRDRALFWYGEAAKRGHAGARAALETLGGKPAPSGAANSATTPRPLVGAASGAAGAAGAAGSPALASAPLVVPLNDQQRLQAMLDAKVPYDRNRAEQLADAIKTRAETGDAESAATLGWFYESRPGGTPDFAVAASWYRRAIELKHPLAANNLGALYYDGRGVEASHTEALRLYRQAAEAGYAVAQYNLALMLGQGRGVERNLPGMLDWLKKSAAQGYSRAQAQLGRFTLDGIGVPKDAVEAGRLFRAAAEQGLPVAQYWYGHLISTSNGVARDLAIAAEWILKAAEGDVAIAAHEAGAIYELGLGLPSNNARAVAWYRKAAIAGVREAASRLEAAYTRGELGLKASPQDASVWAALAKP